VAGNARENFTQAFALVGVTISALVQERLRSLTEEALTRLRPLIDARAAHGVPRDTHGDLHLDHVYFFPEDSPPANLIIVDCIEFNQRFRFADPVADMAFLAMDLLFHGRRDLATVFAAEYFRASGDEDGRDLLPFYTAYRGAVRGKVEGMELAEQEIPATERSAAVGRARAHWLLALEELEAPSHKPCLVLVGGLPGTGKSTLARGLAARAGFCLIRTDLVRKELAAAEAAAQANTGWHEGIYSPEFTERIYAECLRRAEAFLFEGKRVLVDATFREEKRRRAFLDLATAFGVPGILFLCRADSETVRARLRDRQNDVSDADWAVHRMLAESWEEPSPLTNQNVAAISTERSEQEVVFRAIEALRAQRLYE